MHGVVGVDYCKIGLSCAIQSVPNRGRYTEGTKGAYRKSVGSEGNSGSLAPGKRSTGMSGPHDRSTRVDLIFLVRFPHTVNLRFSWYFV